MKRGVWLAVFVLLMQLVLGATIHGKVFDYNFAIAKNSIVRISTVPEQVMVAVDGTYSLDVPKGNYTLTAYLKDDAGRMTYSVEDNISVVNDGDYVRDLILFPSDELNELDLENNVTGELEIIGKTQPQNIVFIATGLIIVILFIWIYCIAFKKCKKRKKVAMGEEEKDDLEGLLAFIRKNKRVTQKEIRKELPLSEAKISLMLTDLESQGKVRKIKKGRGNVIVYDEKRA